ncbi:MAG: DNA primase [Nanoarchaeota archaeon]|nr:DNA primase [Nanoarchaeota archaeon]MBU1269559.1 DNA primase [Nanoarchaeota archaeon]MBU1604709.1 DNA primase [Nanoarchaeota archaeon]MBU2443820.1 DNA primase [Nanoarchaeota archaeon]
MAKIAQVAAKYIIHAKIQIEGVVDKPDVIGAIFGQTEGLLGADLELRELQRSGRIGRIEVNVETKSGKTSGEIIIPSSLDKAETSIVAAALEIIQRIGPCNAKTIVDRIEDIRISKRRQVIERAKELLKNLMDGVLPDSQELADEVSYSVRVMEIQEYGKERLPAGPAIEESDDIIIVEGRADVLNLLKHGFKNAIAINGTSVPLTIHELTKRKVTTAFVDGDRGGNLIIKELLSVADIDFICRAPDGKEVEELTQKEIHKALRGKIASEQAKLDAGATSDLKSNDKYDYSNKSKDTKPISNNYKRDEKIDDKKDLSYSKKKLSDNEKKKFSDMLEDLIGTRGAYILDENINILGKVPVSELQSTVKSLRTGIYAVVLDGVIDKDLVMTAERTNVRFLVAMESKAKSSRVTIITGDDL